ncbi:hypothetical protein BIW53_10860 [Pseudoalteromonas byunsanensis]|uniref:Uncharacterized protein n=1 Tax=Pseudoalteromonas byunsanensis TaxID=327939 RepID=A0A1S1N724_9GAMM|nr:hypothetical protein BIW53_10860 [Pseudoalteromonas byunsanensis]
MNKLNALLLNLMNFLISFGDKQENNSTSRFPSITSNDIAKNCNINSVRLVTNNVIEVTFACGSSSTFKQVMNNHNVVMQPTGFARSCVSPRKLTADTCTLVTGGNLAIKKPRSATSPCLLPTISTDSLQG